MVRLLLILMIGLVFESTGVVLLKKGMMQIGDMKSLSAAEVGRILKEGVTNKHILLGIFLRRCSLPASSS